MHTCTYHTFWLDDASVYTFTSMENWHVSKERFVAAPFWKPSCTAKSWHLDLKSWGSQTRYWWYTGSANTCTQLYYCHCPHRTLQFPLHFADLNFLDFDFLIQNSGWSKFHCQLPPLSRAHCFYCTWLSVRTLHFVSGFPIVNIISNISL